MKKSIRRTVATAVGLLALTQNMYANDLPVLLDSKAGAPEIAIMAKKDETTSSIIQLDEIKAIVEKELGLTGDYKFEDSYLNTDDMYLKKIWQLSYDNKEKNVNVRADAETGQIMAFEVWEDNRKNVLQYTRDEVRKTAIDYLDKHYKKYKSDLVELEETEQLDDVYLDRANHNFVFARKIGGETFLGNYITLSISGMTGEVVALNKRWEDASYKKVADLSTSDTLKYFKDLNAIKVKYINTYKDEKKVLKPVYYLDNSLVGLLDGKTKKFYEEEDIYGSRHTYGTTSDSEEKSANALMMDRKPESQGEEVIPEKGVVSREDAETIIQKSIEAVADIKDMKISSSNYRGNYYGEDGKFWRLYLESEEPEFYVRAVIDASTKEIINMNYRTNKPDNIIMDYARMYKDGEISKEELDEQGAKMLAAGLITQSQYDKRYGNTESVDTEAVKKKANDLIIKMFPLLKGEQLAIEVNDQEDGSLRIEGTRTFDNIPYNRNGFDMEYDIATDMFTFINFDWSYDLQVERPKSILSVDEVSDTFYKEIGIEKSLIQLVDKKVQEKDDVIVPKKELALVYGLNDYRFRYLDAVTGNKLDYSGDSYEGNDDEVRVFNDIDKHAYKRAIQLMNKMGYLNETNETFAPNAILKKKDAIKWVVGTLSKQYRYIPYSSRGYNNEGDLRFKDIGTDDPYYRYVRDAVNMDIIEQANYFNPERTVTMLEVITWVVNGMGQKELATSNIFLDIEDVSSKYDGYVGLGKYYEMVNNKTNLKEELTRGKVVQILYDFTDQLEN